MVVVVVVVVVAVVGTRYVNKFQNIQWVLGQWIMKHPEVSSGISVHDQLSTKVVLSGIIDLYYPLIIIHPSSEVQLEDGKGISFGTLTIW